MVLAFNKDGICDPDLSQKLGVLWPDHATCLQGGKEPWLLKALDRNVLQVHNPVEATPVILRYTVPNMGSHATSAATGGREVPNEDISLGG